jgi:hypothetical protein
MGLERGEVSRGVEQLDRSATVIGGKPGVNRLQLLFLS